MPINEADTCRTYVLPKLPDRSREGVMPHEFGVFVLWEEWGRLHNR
jgi:hypothetical protein